ncbi:hypothetical protein [Marinobacter sp. C2H3]
MKKWRHTAVDKEIREGVKLAALATSLAVGLALAAFMLNVGVVG